MKKYWKLNSLFIPILLSASLWIISCRPKENDVKQDSEKEVARVVEIVRPDSDSYPLIIKSTGYISYDPAESFSITARVSGRIEKLFVKSPFQHVEQGEPLYSIYSPELLTAENNYADLLKAGNDQTLITGARQQLINLGLSEKEISRLAANHKVSSTITIYSPVSGHLHPANAPESSGEMNKQSMPASAFIKEGDYITKGQTLFMIAHTHKVWGILKVYPKDISSIKIHQPVKISLDNTNDSISGEVGFIEPASADNFIRVRVFLDNPDDKIKIGSIISATINAGNVNGLWLPETSVLDLGQKKVVLIKKDNGFEVREVETGYHTGDKVQVISGIVKNDPVVKDARYVYDSDAFIKNQTP
jgi:membrane fusion protein, copper/silver efflux system